jgi:histidine triad (HIT) family protein
MRESEDCFICRKHRGLEDIPGGAIYEDELVFCGHSWSIADGVAPYLGGFIVEPKRHIPGWADLTDREAEAVGKVIRDVCKAVRMAFDAEHVYVFVVGHHIPHLHVWVIPRLPGTPREFWGFKMFEWPGRPAGGRRRVEEACDRVRARMPSGFTGGA